MATEKVRKFAERLRLFRSVRNMNQLEAAGLLGVSPDYISQMELDKKQPGTSLIKLFDLLEGSPIHHSASKLIESTAVYGATVKKAGRQIPIISFTRAGEATDFSEIPLDWEHTTTYYGRDTNAFALTVEGDSMAPIFPSGTTIVVSPQYPPHNGHHVVARIKDEGVLFKLFHHSGDGKIITLSSYNSHYPEMRVARERFHWIWRVVSAERIL